MDSGLKNYNSAIILKATLDYPGKIDELKNNRQVYIKLALSLPGKQERLELARARNKQVHRFMHTSTRTRLGHHAPRLSAYEQQKDHISTGFKEPICQHQLLDARPHMGEVHTCALKLTLV